jgi:hypothetical protein
MVSTAPDDARVTPADARVYTRHLFNTRGDARISAAHLFTDTGYAFGRTAASPHCTR